MSERRLTILFSGMLAGDPGQGGASWAVLQYLLGFRKLGHDVYFVEPVTPAALGEHPTRSLTLKYFNRVVRASGLSGCCALLANDDSHRTAGLTYQNLLAVARRADVLFNISGMLTDPDLLSCIPVRVYLDLDPAFVQLWHAVEGVDMRFAAHTHHVTVGLSIGREGCEIPTCGVAWRRTLPPVVLNHWRQASTEKAPQRNGFTTIANWRAYGSIHHGGWHYGQKAHSLRELIDLPSRTPQPLSLALSIHPDEVNDLIALKANGWHLLDPAKVAATPATYRRFVRGSKGELGVAKSGYVVSRCGWFSDRSACYLASGRPVVAQETGFSKHLPIGRGLLAFSSTDEAAEAIQRINADYATHAAAAREIAVSHFDSDRVLTRLLRLAEVQT